MDFYIHRFPDATDMPIPPVAEHASHLSAGEKARIFRGNVLEAYGIEGA